MINPFLNSTQSKNSPIIIALDYNNESDVMNLVKQIDPSLCKLKVGKELFTSCGPAIVEKLVIAGFDVFLDLKFHDIPNTVYKACKSACNLGIWMLNVHVSGGMEMLNMAKMAIAESHHKPLLIGVTVLTSMSDKDLQQLKITSSLTDHVIHLSKIAHMAQMDGVVCSAQESTLIKHNTHANFLTITPGIRLNSTNKLDDQTRIVTPYDAIHTHKVDYMVIGRPITQSSSPLDTIHTILQNINESDIS